MKIQGICSRRKLSVELSESGIIVTTLSGEQKGSIFTYELDELKKKSDVYMDSATTRYQTGWLGAILLFCFAGFCAASWGEGIATESFWVSIILLPLAVLLAKTAPKKKVYLWQTNGGIQAFGLEESESNKEEIQRFIADLESKIESNRR